MSKESSTTGGIGFFGALAILFIALKLMHYIDWSWWWVLSPILIPIGLIIGGLVIFLFISFCLFIYKKLKK